VLTDGTIFHFVDTAGELVEFKASTRRTRSLWRGWRNRGSSPA